jgi:hypothetical protein
MALRHTGSGPVICRAAEWLSNACTAFFAHPITVMVTMLLSAASFAWACISPTELSWTLFLSILAIAMQAADLFKSRNDA